MENTGHPLTVPVGDELLGHMVDGIGRPTDAEGLTFDKEYPVEALPPDPMTREIINTVLPLGVKAVDGLITVGKRSAYWNFFAGSGVGKKYTDGNVCKKHQSGYQCHSTDRRARQRGARIRGAGSW